MKLICAINFYVFAAVLAAGSLAGDVYVNNQNGDDSRKGGSAAQSVRTLKRAVKLCSAGTTLHIADTGRIYYESLNFGARGGTPAAPIIVEGNRAVLSGLNPLPSGKWQNKGKGLYFFPSDVRKKMPAARPYLFLNGKVVPRQKTPSEIKTEESCWNDEGVYFRVAVGKNITDYELEGTGRISGLILSGASYIEVRNLVCERFANDGFNVHGCCQGLVFRNITGRWNGDDGFSVHEDVGATVLGGYFHHNDYGIQDINISRSSFYGVLVENNRRAGADFRGGVHVLYDSVIRNNAGPQIRLARDSTRHIRISEGPLTDGVLILRNTLTIGGKYGVAVKAGRADISNCSFVEAEIGAYIGTSATAVMVGNAIYGCKKQELILKSGTGSRDANLYAPGRISWQKKVYEPAAFDTYQADSEQDAGSVVISTSELPRTESFRLNGKRLSYGKHHIRPGIKKELSFPLWNSCPQHKKKPRSK
ncbi:MAG: right-handed parallel beta-helix repeat-containing protein [Kiritimatiellia bacterium]